MTFDTKSSTRSKTSGERGQIVLFAAISMVAMLAIASLAIDVGSLTQERRELQNDADAMALAGGSQIRNSGAGNLLADAEAKEWAVRNNVANAEVEEIKFGETCSGDTVENTITVTLRRTKDTFLAGIIGVDEGTVRTCATAAHYSATGGVGVAPFGVEIDCIYGPDETPGTGDDWSVPGDIITIKYDSQNKDNDDPPCANNQGNFWLLAIDEPGTGDICGSPVPADSEERQLREAICFGSITPLCTPEAVLEDEDCETSVDTQTGNINSIKGALEYLVANAPDDCDTLDKIVVDGEVVDACNPFLPGYPDDAVTLVKMIPLLDGLYPVSNGKSNVAIVDFLLVVIDPAQITGAGWCTGSVCDVQALFLAGAQNPQAFREELDDDAANNFTVLIN